ncbi:MAG: hypothetical protein LBH43_04930 [Treponema sp.]|jgi:hypothetical protein|nr:hypothetical protein [Treponema sp.]
MVDFKKIQRQVSENWPAKVLSIVAAIFLFAFHRTNDFQERIFSVPLNIEIPANLVPSSSYPQNIRITLRGTNRIYDISPADIEAYIDFSRFSEPGIYKVQVGIQQKGSAADAGILEINADPAEINLELDNRVSKVIPITPNYSGYPEQGYEMVSFLLEPNQVIIEGPEKFLLTLFELKTEYIDLKSRKADFSEQVLIENTNPFISIRGDNTVEFKGFIKELILIKNLDRLGINVIGLNESFEAILDPPVALARIYGVQSMLDSGMVTLNVDCSNITAAGFYELPLSASTQNNIGINRLEPENIKVEIKQREIQ